MEDNKFAVEFKKLGLKIAYFRKVKGLTQEQLAELMGVATSYIGAVEAPNMHKTISLTTLFKIAQLLEIKPSKLLEFD